MPPPVLRRSSLRPPIIAALLLLAAVLAGCSLALELGYDQGSPIAFRWLDGFVDFDDAQSLRVRGALDEWFAWHRRSQLPDYADLLARAERELPANTTPERVCAWSREIRSRFDTAFEHARPALAEVVVTLTSQQIAHIEKQLAARNTAFREHYLQPDPAERRQAAVEREIERAGRLYGSLDDAQQRMIARRVADSPFDAGLSYGERLRRQQDALALLRRHAGTGSTAAAADADVRAYVQRYERSPDDAYRRYAQRLDEYDCAFAAALHNRTSSEQRRVAVEKLAGYEGELRSLAAVASS